MLACVHACVLCACLCDVCVCVCVCVLCACLCDLCVCVCVCVCVPFYRLKQLQAAHAQEVARLQRSVQDELGRRQAAERGLVELQGEVAIGMEDLQPVGAPGMEGEPKSLGISS